MRLTAVRVRDFKSINDSTYVDLDSQVICLVGKNESGKTAFLEALYRLNPLPSGHPETFDQLYDFPRPRRSTTDEEDILGASPITAWFELDVADVEAVEYQWGTGVLPSKSLQVSKNYRNERLWKVSVDEGSAVRHLVSSAGLGDEYANGVETVADLTTKLEQAGEEEIGAKDLLGRIADLDLDAEVRKILVERFPKFLYFDDYNELPGTVSIPFLQSGEELDTHERTALALLKLARVDTTDMTAEHEAAIAALESASAALRREVLKYWTQNRDIRVDLRLDFKTPEEEPGKGPPHLDIRIQNLRHEITLNFAQRSRGFQWFFSFLVAFSEYRKSTEDIILLLDEPGLGLHASAQEDFLRYIDEVLAAERKVIYSTHSPFMVEPTEIERVRTVEDTDENGTVVSADFLKTSRETLFPLQAALGYTLSQSLFVAEHNLLVEGPAEFLYFSVISDHLKAQNREGLDDRWVIVPVGGLDKVPTFLALLNAQLEVVAVVDVAHGGLQKLQSMVDKGVVEEGQLIPITKITDTKQADTEDLFAQAFYLKLLRDSGTAKVTASDLPKGDRIIKRVEQASGGPFDHYRPARWLATHPELLDKLDGDTLDRFEALFSAINARLR